MERRITERRDFNCAKDFPLVTATGTILKDRRRQPDRRLNNIEATFLDIAYCALPNG